MYVVPRHHLELSLIIIKVHVIDLGGGQRGICSEHLYAHF